LVERRPNNLEMEPMARVFVTGASGFLGGLLIASLVERGHAVSCACRSIPRARVPAGNAEWIQADLREPHKYSDALVDADYVIHLAGLLKARRRSEYRNTNVDGTGALLEACLRKGTHIRRFVFTSSVAAMGPTYDGALLSEATTCRPRSEYGASKLAAERLIREAAVSFSTVILRPSFIYGVGDARGAMFLRDLLGPVHSVSRLAISTLSCCHVSDAVRACALALEAEGAADQTFLVAEPKPYKWGDVYAILERAFETLATSGHSSQTQLARFLQSRVRASCTDSTESPRGEHWGCDTRKAAVELGFQALRSLDEAAVEVVNSYLQGGNLAAVYNTAFRSEV
jgi:nucleoside-diphosphate-sugar epimerase